MPDTLLPAAYDVVWSLVALAQVVLVVLALVEWSRARVTGGGGVVDALVILLVPVVGPAAYLVGRRRAGRADQVSSSR